MRLNPNNSIVNLSNSLLKHFGADTHNTTIPNIDSLLKGHKKVCLLLFDGMGKYIEDMHSNILPYVCDNIVHSITSTFPPTTVAATTGFLTGRFPIENGWMSWTQYLEKYGCNVDVFRNKNTQTGETVGEGNKLVLSEICPTTTIIEEINKARGKQIAFDMADIFGAYKGPNCLTLARWKLNKLLKGKEECLVYYYYEWPDHDIHGFGVKGKPVKKDLKRINRFCKKIAAKNPDTLFLCFADHGLIDIEYKTINDHQDLMDTLQDGRFLSLERRAPVFFIKPDKKEEFKKLFNEYYGEWFELVAKEDAIKDKLFGEGPINPIADSILGDFIAIAKTKYTLRDLRDVRAFMAIGHHGGGTDEEMEINISAFNR